ncbi:MAG: DUF3237 domain-containing protein [Burkholderiaceae bacterium]|nr:DUF3237 domain-containing protein [Burkholderiaceae bacterium]
MNELPPPDLRPCLRLDVEVGAPVEVGASASSFGYGHRRVIPITGGRVQCEHVGGTWKGRVLPGGADFQRIVGDRAACLEARYVIETDAGDRIYVENHALRSGSADDIGRLARGEPVDPARIYFRCIPRFETASPSLAWMMERLFVGTGARRPDRVELRVFEVA